MEFEEVQFIAIVAALFLTPAAIVGILFYLDLKSYRRRSAGIPKPEKNQPRGFEVKTSGNVESVSESEDLM